MDKTGSTLPMLQMGREEGGQNLRMWQIQPRAEAPRQRRKCLEPRPEIVRRSTQIRLRTESIYGTLVIRNRANAWLICTDDGAKILRVYKTCWSQASDQDITAIRPGLHPGNRYSLSSGKELPGTRESHSSHLESNLPAVGMEVGGVIVVRGRESRPHGEGHQPSR